jgi:hypothetical protein
MADKNLCKEVGWRMKTAIICTNQHREDGPTPIFKCSAVGGKVTFLGASENVHDPDFIVDFSKETIQGHWGGRLTMTKEEAAAFGADFGLWFSS